MLIIFFQDQKQIKLLLFIKSTNKKYAKTF